VRLRRNTTNFVPKTKQQEADMRKLITLGVAVLAIGLWLMPIRVAAQGRAVGRTDGASGGFGSHAPLGAPGGDVNNRHGSAHDTTTSGTKDTERKTPDQLLSENTKLSENLTDLLTKMGVSATPQAVCQNFKNLGQCVAAMHVANNLGITLNSLVCDMTRKPIGGGMCTTIPSKAMSLGASIDALKPGTDGKTEAQKAVTQANQDVKGSGS
jgi:hypothetical protein